MILICLPISGAENKNIIKMKFVNEYVVGQATNNGGVTYFSYYHRINITDPFFLILLFK